MDDHKRLVVGPPCFDDEERKACAELDPHGFFIRHPPKPHLLNTFITSDDHLFQTIHMGAAVIDLNQYKITIDGLVEHPFSLTLDQLKQFSSTTITSFHEYYGSPLKPPVENVWRIGNVKWTGMPLRTILEQAKPLPGANFVSSDGLDYGTFGGVKSDRYQKDLPIDKAWSPEVLVAYEMNGKPLTRKRGGPLRLVVPGWFGTNSTKWLCRLSLQAERACGPFTTKFYNEKDPADPKHVIRPVWVVEPNSMIVNPESGIVIRALQVEIVGWAWSYDGIKAVSVNVDSEESLTEAKVEPRVDFSWQRFKATIDISPGSRVIFSLATSTTGLQQPLTGRRNHVHTIHLEIL